jgi:hypothetical protein
MTFSYLIPQQCFAKLQVVSFQDGGPMELGQWILGSETGREGGMKGEREREGEREYQHG